MPQWHIYLFIAIHIAIMCVSSTHRTSVLEYISKNQQPDSITSNFFPTTVFFTKHIIRVMKSNGWEWKKAHFIIFERQTVLLRLTCRVQLHGFRLFWRTIAAHDVPPYSIAGVLYQRCALKQLPKGHTHRTYHRELLEDPGGSSTGECKHVFFCRFCTFLQFFCKKVQRKKCKKKLFPPFFPGVFVNFCSIILNVENCQI